MKMYKKTIGVFTAVTLASSILAACGGSDNNAADSSSAPSSSTAGQASPSSPAVEKKYKISAMTILYGAAPSENGSGRKAIEERYNIDFEYIPVASGEYTNKLGVTLASGDIPDALLFPGLDSIYFNAIDSDRFLPLDQYLNDSENYPNLASLPKEVMDNLKYKGHIYGIPRLRGIPGHTLTLRKDWLDNLGLEIPTTYDELYDVMKAFTENDPDGNGKKDTYGTSIGVNNGAIIMTNGIMSPLMGGPSLGWVEDGNGGIVPAEFAPSAKDVIGFLAKLYKDGLIAQDFTIKKEQQAEDDFLLGKTGSIGNMAYTAFNVDRLKKARTANPDFEMISIPPLKGLDGSESGYKNEPGFFGVFTLSKELANDEGKLKKVLQILDDQIGDEGAEFFKWGVEDVHHKVENGEKVVTELGMNEGPNKYHLTNHAHVDEWILSSNDTEETKELKQQAFAVASQGKPWSPQEIGLFSKTNAEKGEELRKYAGDEIIKIVVGNEPVDYLDQIFAEWKRRGGDEVLKEMNEAWNARK